LVSSVFHQLPSPILQDSDAQSTLTLQLAKSHYNRPPQPRFAILPPAQGQDRIGCQHSARLFLRQAVIQW